ncbi:MAG: alanine--tRNA ligase [Holosporales bacterium]
MTQHAHVRNSFIRFFKEHGHTLVAPSPIIPADDPTLLFTNAGMNQFKDVLLGKEKRAYTRAISVQPCMRVGGKHNDLDEVGRDGRHLTWFEMLGNWSFGDYGKEAAIRFAWEFVTKELHLDTSRIHVSVYKNDDEAHKLWRSISGLPEARIVRLGDIEQGDEENFWSMGPTGPCGRCTELYYDQGEALFGPDVVGGKTDRFLEFWNLVFMEFNRDEAGVMTPLPMLSVDTGMGMERITAILEGKSNVFDTSLFAPFIQHVAHLCGREAEGEALTSMRVLADHVRGLTFTLAEGASFDRAGRGYVRRRILRRAVLWGKKLGFEAPFLHSLVDKVIEILPFYNLSPAQVASVRTTIRGEEEKFFETLDRGLVFFAKAASHAKNNIISGPEAFQLHDTYGFPVDLTRLLAEERGLSVDAAGFEKALDEQRHRSAAAADFYDKGGWVKVAEGEPGGFAGHDADVKDVTVLQYRVRDEGQVDLLLGTTPFYVEGGGESADHGTLHGGSVHLTVLDVQKTDLGVVHTARLDKGGVEALAKLKTLHAHVDTARRSAKAAHHTATHLLHAGLRRVLGAGVRQAGSLVEADRLRFDIRFERALTLEEILAVEAWVNDRVRAAEPVTHLPDMTMAEAQAMGALAFFGDKYGERVRVINIPGESCELCGGNHVRNTGEIGQVLILSDEALGSGIRRLEAVAGAAALRLAQEQRASLRGLARRLSVPVEAIAGRVEKLQHTLKEKEAALKKAARSGGGIDTEALLRDAVIKDAIRIIVADVGTMDEEIIMGGVTKLRALADVVVVLVADVNEKGLVLIGAGSTAQTKGHHAGKLAKAIGEVLGSGGGGKPDFARTGFKDKDTKEATALATTAVFKNVP